MCCHMTFIHILQIILSVLVTIRSLVSVTRVSMVCSDFSHACRSHISGMGILVLSRPSERVPAWASGQRRGPGTVRAETPRPHSCRRASYVLQKYQISTLLRFPHTRCFWGGPLCSDHPLCEGVPRPTRGENSDTPDCYAEKGVSFQTDGRGSYSLTLRTEPMSAGSHLS